MKKLVFVLPAVSLLGLLLMPSVTGEGEVDAVVTPLVLAVNVNPTDVDYGTMAPSIADNQRTTKGSPSISAMNVGSVTVDLMIRGSDATTGAGGGSTWIINCSPAATGTVGTNQFVHRFDIGTFDDGSALALCSDSDKTLAADVIANGSVDFILQMNMPTGTTGFGQRTTTVTVIAVEPGP